MLVYMHLDRKIPQINTAMETNSWKGPGKLSLCEQILWCRLIDVFQIHSTVRPPNIEIRRQKNSSIIKPPFMYILGQNTSKQNHGEVQI